MRSLIGLGACLALAAGVVIWSLTATVDRVASVQSVNLVGGSVARVVSPAAGIVSRLEVVPGAEVSEGQVIGQITTPTDQRVVLTAPVDGAVLNVNSAVGSSVSEGEGLVSIERAEGVPTLRAFVSPAQAAQLRVGSRAVIDFPDRQPIDGHVLAIAALPLTEPQVADELGSVAVAATLVDDKSVVGISLLPDEAGQLPMPSPHDNSGRTATVRLILDRQHPIDFVL